MYYYQHHIGDFLKDAGNLTHEQLGVYMRMLWAYYDSEKPFVDSCEDIAFAMRSDEKTVHLLLKHFFVLQDDGWHQPRCDREIAHFHGKSEKASSSAKARWANAKAMRTHSEGNAEVTKNDANQEPITNNQEPKIKTTSVVTPEGVSQEVWEDFLKHRRAKKAPLSTTALNGIKKEAQKAGISLQEALEMCCQRGWTGFKAEWVQEQQVSGREPAWRKEQRNFVQQAVPSIAAANPVEFFDVEARNVTTVALG